MTATARRGLKRLRGSQCAIPNQRRNDRYSPSGIETIRCPVPGSLLHGLKDSSSPFGIETSGHTTVALVEEEEEASPAGSQKKTAATSGELAEPLPPAPGPLGSGIRSSQGADCRCDCGSADERARPL